MFQTVVLSRHGWLALSKLQMDISAPPRGSLEHLLLRANGTLLRWVRADKQMPER